MTSTFRFAALRLVFVALVFASSTDGALAQSDYPDRPIRFVVTTTAGGPSDVFARTIGQKLSDSLGKPVVIDNRPGAGGNIGRVSVAKSRPDGYTIVVNIATNLAINESLYSNLPYDAMKDFEPVTKIGLSAIVLVAHPSLPANSIKELIALAKAKPGALSFGSSATGSAMHIGGELLNSKAGIKLAHIPYKGASPALTDLLGGQIPLAIVGLPAALPYVKAGRLKALGVMGAARSALAPDVPTFVESGLPGLEAELVYGIFAPAGTPKPIISRLNSEIATLLRLPEIKERLLGYGFELISSTPEELGEYLKAEIARWRPIVKASGATID